MDAVAVLGGGRMGEAIIAGLLRGGRRPGDVRVAERYPERAAELEAAYGVAVRSAAQAVDGARQVIVATKPPDVADVLKEITAILRDDVLVLSVAAGITTTAIEAALPAGTAVVRAMPNTPALLGAGMTAIAAGVAADDRHLDAAEALLAPLGRVARVDEAQLDAVTAVSGSGPAYFFLLAEALIDAAVAAGLPATLAAELVTQTALGAGRMLRESAQSPAALREAVTSPGGTTAAALRVFEDAGLRDSVGAAVRTAAERSREMGRGAQRSRETGRPT